MANIYPKIKKGRKDKLPKDIKEGQILATTDTFEVFIDIEQTRIQLSTQKAGSTDYVKWSDVAKNNLGFSASAPTVHIPYIDVNGTMTLAKKLSFYPNNTIGDPVQTIVCDENGFEISGIVKGSFKGNLDGTANEAKKIVDSDDADSKIGVSFNKAELGLTDITHLAAWKDGEIRKILATNFIEDNLVDTSGSTEGLKHMTFKYIKYCDSYNMTMCWSLINPNEVWDTFTKDDIEDHFPSYCSNVYSLFLAFIKASSSTADNYGTEDQFAFWLIYAKQYGSANQTKYMKWQKMNLASYNYRTNSDGTEAGWRFTFVSIDDYDRFGIKVYKGSGAMVSFWRLL